MYAVLNRMRKSIPEPLKARLRGPRKLFRRFFLLPLRRSWYQRLPIAMITGTKGKTTTSRMLAHILSKAGFNVGLTTTDGLVIAGELLHEYDSSGYLGHGRVLKDPSVTAAVLETARGSLHRDGLYIDRCDVAALLNVGREQIGIDGIDTVEQMAEVKRKVIDAARKTVVLNADDPLCCKLIDEFPVHRTTIFSFNPECRAAREHLKKGGQAIFFHESGEPRIVRVQDSHAQSIISIADLPSACGGFVRHNIANAMAAAALAYGLGIPSEIITASLRSFENTVEQCFARFNIIRDYPFLVILDLAISPPAAECLAECLTGVDVEGRRLCAMSTLGDRPSWHYQELTAALAQSFDHFVCYEVEKYRRGRAPGEITNLLKSGLLRNAVAVDSIDVTNDYESALRALSAKAMSGDLVAILGMHRRQDFPLIRRAFASHIPDYPAAYGTL